jgi:hypothetical protein
MAGKNGDGGGDNVIKQTGGESAVSSLQPEHVSLIGRGDTGIASGVNLYKQTDSLKAANESLDGSNPYSHLSAADAQTALAQNEAAIKQAQAYMVALNIKASQVMGRNDAENIYGHVSIG